MVKTSLSPKPTEDPWNQNLWDGPQVSECFVSTWTISVHNEFWEVLQGAHLPVVPELIWLRPKLFKFLSRWSLPASAMSYQSVHSWPLLSLTLSTEGERGSPAILSSLFSKSATLLNFHVSSYLWGFCSWKVACRLDSFPWSNFYIQATTIKNDN